MKVSARARFSSGRLNREEGSVAEFNQATGRIYFLVLWGWGPSFFLAVSWGLLSTPGHGVSPKWSHTSWKPTREKTCSACLFFFFLLHSFIICLLLTSLVHFFFLLHFYFHAVAFMIPKVKPTQISIGKWEILLYSGNGKTQPSFRGSKKQGSPHSLSVPPSWSSVSALWQESCLLQALSFTSSSFHYQKGIFSCSTLI